MSQNIKQLIGVSPKVKLELEHRKKILASKQGRAVSFDDVLRHLLGWS